MTAGSRGAIKAIISVAFLAIILFLVVRQGGVSELSHTARAVSFEALAIAFGTLVLGVLLAAARVKVVAADLGYSLTWRDALTALGLGQLAGVLFFQLVGQLIARGAYLFRRGLPVGASVVMVGYERILALGISLLLASLGAWHLFGRIAVDIQGGGDEFLKLLAGIVLATAAGAWFGWGQFAASRVVDLLHGNTVWRIARGALLSLAIQLATATAYVTIAHSFAPEIGIFDLASASFVVMLVAAIPISLAGWGLREFSAVLALGAIGMTPAAALLTAALIGVGSLIAVAPLAGLGLVRQAATPPLARETAPRIDYNKLISIAVPLAAATAVFFQIHLPIGAGRLNVNLADPLAILGGVFFLVVCVISRRALPRWRLVGLNLHILLTVAVMTSALLIGAVRIGWTDWALANKYAGWFVLLGYGATGALVVSAAGSKGLRMLLATFAAAGIAIGVLELILLAVRSAGIDVSPKVLWYDPYGFAQNRNAFAFQMLMVFASATALGLFRRSSAAALAFVLAAIWVTGSRAGYGATAVTLGMALYVRALTAKQAAVALSAAFCIVTGIIAVEIVVNLAVLLQSVAGEIFTLLPDLFMGRPVEWPQIDFSVVMSIGNTKIAGFSLPDESTNADRLRSILGGIELFRSHPVFGAGLGTFVESEVQSGRAPLIVHSTPVWLLSEMGLVGLAIFAAPVLRIFWSEVRRDSPDAPARVLVLIIAAFAVMSLAHEMLYQRTFWLLLGAALACPFAPETERSGSQHVRRPEKTPETGSPPASRFDRSGAELYL